MRSYKTFLLNTNCPGLTDPGESASTQFTDSDSIAQTSSQSIFKGKNIQGELVEFSCFSSPLCFSNLGGKKCLLNWRSCYLLKPMKAKEEKKPVHSQLEVLIPFPHHYWPFLGILGIQGIIQVFTVTKTLPWLICTLVSPTFCASQSLPPAVLGAFRSVCPCPCGSRGWRYSTLQVSEWVLGSREIKGLQPPIFFFKVSIDIHLSVCLSTYPPTYVSSVLLSVTVSLPLEKKKIKLF